MIKLAMHGMLMTFRAGFAFASDYRTFTRVFFYYFYI